MLNFLVLGTGTVFRIRFRCQSPQIITVPTGSGSGSTTTLLILKELSHEIEMGCFWYGWKEPYLEMNLWKFVYLFIASWFLTLNFTFFRGIAQRLPLCVQLGQPICNVPKVVSNPLANFLHGVRGYWQPSGKFVTGCQRLLAALWQILQRVLATFANSTYWPEGCQHPLILGQRV